MEDKLVYFDLCGALSDIFVDNEADLKYILLIEKISLSLQLKKFFLNGVPLFVTPTS